MPRKREPEGRPKMFNELPSDIVKKEAYLHSNPPKGTKPIKMQANVSHFIALFLFQYSQH